MKKRKLKAFVLPMLYVMIIGTIFVSVGLLSVSLNVPTPTIDYSVNSIIEDVQPVISETIEQIIPAAPYRGENVIIEKDYYSKDDDELVQQNSLIRYENTYMENTGIMYTAENPFNVVSTLDGTVVSIKDNEFLGNVIEVKHTNNLSTYYYSLSEIVVKEGDFIKAGDILGTSGTNKIISEKPTLLFEVYYKGKSIDPELFYQTDIKTYE